MKLSIITINLNNKYGLKNTIASVINQTLDVYEFIVIDGGSDDGSLEIIQDHEHLLSFWISEPDRGVYHAMNKGIRKANGEYVLFLNSGDLLFDNNVLECVFEGINDNLDIYYGDVIMFDKNTEKLKQYPRHLTFSYLYHGTLPHQGSFIRRLLFDTMFYYNENYKIVSDWEFFIRAICLGNASYKHLGFVISKYDINGMSTSNRALKFEEREDVLNNHFRPFMEDHKDLFQLRQLKNQKILQNINQSPIGKKIHFLYLKVMSLFFK